MTYKKITAVLLAGALLFLGACSSGGNGDPDPPALPEQTEVIQSEPETRQETTEPEPEPDPDPLASVTSLEMARLMGYGINLGNTMEACDYNNRIPNRDPSDYETMWGQPVTTPEMIRGMRDAGFKTLRIPVAWTNAMDFENDDFTIGEPYLARVAEIINYALDADMYVIINAHWDHGWWSMFGSADETLRNKAHTMFIEMWSQIAEYYKDYDHRLLFAPSNEEWGDRFNDRTKFVNDERGVLSEDECYALLTSLAQDFIDLVRGTGGLNTDRFLIVPGYNTDVQKTISDKFQMPTDTANSRLLLQVHYYTPWSYCGDTAGVAGWGTTGEVTEMNNLLGSLTKYTNQGYGIILGEWGVLDNDGDDRESFFFNFLSNCDLYGYVPVLWDTGGLFDRQNAVIRAPEIARLFARRVSEPEDGMPLDEIIVNAESNLEWALRKAGSRPEFVYEADEAFAWIMFASGDWGVQYSVGDKYQPESIAKDLIATDVEVTGAGRYEVALDFTQTADGYANGIAFAAVGIVNGDLLFPEYIMDIEVFINGEPAVFTGKPYTSSDNGVTTRVNLYNEWVTDIPGDARVPDGDTTGLSAVPMSGYVNTRIETLTVVFDYIEP